MRDVDIADIYVNYGTDAARMAVELMERADVAADVGAGTRVTVKPNLVAARPANSGSTTHSAIVEGIIQFLRDHGVRDITIAEGSWVGDSTVRAFEMCGYAALAKKYGARLVDTKRDKALARQSRHFGNMSICESAANTDYLINVPVLKGHCQTGMTCCLKNMKGLIPDSEKRRYHTAGLDRPIAALNTIIKPRLHIIDSICGDLDFEEGGNPVVSNRLMLGFDPVLLDSRGAELMGYSPDDIGHLRLAREYGVGRYADGSTRIVELNADAKPRVANTRAAGGAGSGVRRAASHIEEDGACSACYAALVFALNQAGSGYRGGKIKVGQGFKGRSGLAGIGSGDCTAGCVAHVKGCPPTARKIVEFLHGQ